MNDIEKLQKALELIESLETETYEMTKIQIEQEIEMLIRWLDPEVKHKDDLIYNNTILKHER